jgi:hypothetical protein
MKELDDNMLNQLIQSILENRKEPVMEPELPEDMKELEDLKRARYEALQKKYKD